MLFKGHFRTPILSVNTRVDFEIRNNYEVIATFLCQDVKYTFHMKKWAKARETVQTAASSFNFFASLLTERFSQCSDFGTEVVDEKDGGSVITVERTAQQILNIIKYATRDVFICAENIIQKYRRAVLDYASFHRERGSGKPGSYEEYIHLVACQCLTHSNFQAPNVDYPLVDFCLDEQVFRPDALTSIVPDVEEEEED